MFNIKLEEKSYKWAWKLYRLKYSGQKTDSGGGGRTCSLRSGADRVKLHE